MYAVGCTYAAAAVVVDDNVDVKLEVDVHRDRSGYVPAYRANANDFIPK